MTTVQTWRYSIPSERGNGWAIAFVDSIGCFSVLSDYGDYGYRWPQAGWGPGDFRRFLLQCNDDYILRKLARRDHYDGEATLRNVKDVILQNRRSLEWSADRAREEWSLLRTYDDLERREDFARWYDSTRIDCAYEHARVTFDPSALAFMTKVWPRITAAIREDLARSMLVLDRDRAYTALDAAFPTFKWASMDSGITQLAKERDAASAQLAETQAVLRALDEHQDAAISKAVDLRYGPMKAALAAAEAKIVELVNGRAGVDDVLQQLHEQVAVMCTFAGAPDGKAPDAWTLRDAIIAMKRKLDAVTVRNADLEAEIVKLADGGNDE